MRAHDDAWTCKLNIHFYREPVLTVAQTLSLHFNVVASVIRVKSAIQR